MSQIFLSWASADGAVVNRLIQRLYNLGLGTGDDSELPTLWQYRREMQPGAQITAAVNAAIKRSDVAVMCLSDAALDNHSWIIAEAALVRAAKDDGTLGTIIPVKVGPVSPDKLAKIASFVASPNDFLADVSEGSEEDLLRLGKAIFEAVKKKTPKVVPIAVIAMVDAQATKLFFELKDSYKEKAKSFWDLCRAVGMKDPPALLTAFADRYGEHPEDIRPFKLAAEPGPADPDSEGQDPETEAAFPEDDTLMDIIHESLTLVNAARVKRDERPIFPRWIHGELFPAPGPDGKLSDEAKRRKQDAERLWTSHDSLLVIDQISLFNEEVLEQLSALPAASESSRTAALCLPPYTQHTLDLEARLGTLADEFQDLRLLFDEWTNTERMISFDTTTSVSLRLWLHRRFTMVPDKDPPVSAKVRSMPASRRSAPRQLRPQNSNR